MGLFLCLVIFFLHSQCLVWPSLSALCPPDQSIALLELYKTSSDNHVSFECKDYKKKKSWKEGIDCCEWEGVTCESATGNVIGLDLSCRVLLSSIQSNSSLFLLSNLQKLKLGFNNESSSKILPEFGSFVNLTHLNLSWANFDGQVPIEISYLSRLVSLDLSNTGLRFQNHVWISLLQNLTQLRELDLHNMNLSSIVPSSFMNFPSSLTSLSLSNCSLSGILPERFLGITNIKTLDLSDNLKLTSYHTRSSNWSSSLRYIDLFFTNSFGELPNTIGNLEFLQHLDLSYCHFNGQIPPSFSNLTQLIYLNLGSNSFSGQILPSFSNLTQLIHLNLIYNSFSGQIPLSFSNLTQLIDLNVANNNFSGQIPPSFSNLTQLIDLNLANNNFSGQIPPSFSNLTQLIDLNLGFNSFSGQIPPSFSNLTQLIHLDLSYNSFSGQIPPSFSNLHSLVNLCLSENHLTGKIPYFFDKLSSLQFLEMKKNNFVDQLPPSLMFNMTQLQILDLSHNQLLGSVSTINFPLLNCLDLSYNSLSGSIPPFVNMSSLEIIFLQSNNFQGLIPSSIFTQVIITEINLSSNNLSGVVEFYRSSELKYLEILDLSFNSGLQFMYNYSANSTFLVLRYLSLSCCNLSELPYFLKDFSNLRTLELSHNQIQGYIPKWFFDVGRDSLRRLNLSHNMLTHIEQIPWMNLGVLDIQSNLLQGPLVDLPSSLAILLASNNKFTGEISNSICSLSSIEVLDLSRNNLRGLIPPCLAVPKYLSVLNLNTNRFHGPIPKMFSKGSMLRSFNLNGNELEGSLPKSLLNCEFLEVLDVGSNKLDGGFPHWLESLPNLQVLVLKSNRFYGYIGNPNIESPFQKLRIMDLSNNNFSGHLPAKYFENFKAIRHVLYNDTIVYMGPKYIDYYKDSVMVTMKDHSVELVKILTTFTTIDLSRNDFNGEIPEVVGELKSLKGLNLSHNKLTGPIPTMLGGLTELEWLDFSSNELTGMIPQQLSGMTSLASLKLSYNNLEGVIPHGNQFGTFDNDSYIGNKGLCGFPLSQLCNKGDDVEQKGGSDPINWIDWKVIFSGYACGLVFGIYLGYLLFTIEKVNWHLNGVINRWRQKLKRRKQNGSRN